jgi:hypothetical protein
MAAIFQIRRGTSDISSSIVDGELYLHKGKNSLQVSIGDGNPITLLALNTSSVGNINLTGNLSASNAYFSGDVAISGNLFLGNQTTDTITATGEFTSNLIPNPSNTYSIGSTSKVWKEIHATSFSGSFSGSINGINEGISAFSTSVDSRLDRLQDSTSSLNTFSASVLGHISDINTYTSSINLDLARIHESTASLNSFTSSQESKNIVIGAYTASMNSFTSSQESKNIVIGAYTASMNSFTSSVNEHISDINTYTASLRTAIDVTGGNTRIIGNLIVDGTQTSLNVNNVYVEDKLITLSSGSATSLLSDGSGFEIAGANVSMSWEHTNTRFGINTNVGIIGSISSSTIVGLNGDSVTVYSTSVDSRLSNLQSTSASVSSSLSNLQLTSASVNSSLLNLELTSASVSSSLSNLELTSASVSSSLSNLQLTSASVSSSLSNLQLTSTSVSSSLSNLQLTSASVSSSLSNLQLTFASVSSSLSNLQLTSASVSSSLSNLQLTSASVSSSLSQINLWTGSGFFNTFSTSVDSLLDGLRYDVDLLTPVGLSASFGSLNVFTSSANSRLTSIEAATSSYEIKGSGIVSGSSQITPLLPTGVISGSSQITLILPTGTVSGSSQVSYTGLSNIPANIISSSSQITYANISSIPSGIVSGAAQMAPLLPGGVVSSSLQLSSEFEVIASSTHTLVSGSSQITYASISSIPPGIVSGSSQITLSSTTGGSTSSHVQFHCIGLGTAASGVVGEVRATGDITAFYSSDIRLKENIQPIENALEKVESISGNTYDWKAGYEEIHSHKGNDIGVIAQEIESILPQIVTNRDNGYKAVQYEKIVPLLIEAIKELSAKIKRLENK